jgi:hypothetical protein
MMSTIFRFLASEERIKQTLESRDLSFAAFTTGDRAGNKTLEQVDDVRCRHTNVPSLTRAQHYNVSKVDLSSTKCWNIGFFDSSAQDGSASKSFSQRDLTFAPTNRYLQLPFSWMYFRSFSPPSDLLNRL